MLLECSITSDRITPIGGWYRVVYTGEDGDQNKYITCGSDPE